MRDLTDAPIVSTATTITSEVAREAAVTAAEYAIAGGWVSELGGVLDTLGLRGES